MNTVFLHYYEDEASMGSRANFRIITTLNWSLLRQLSFVPTHPGTS